MRKPPTPTIVTLAVFTTVTVVLWIFVSVYNILIKKAPVDVPDSLLEPMDEVLDTQTLQKIKERIFIEEGQEKPFTVVPQFSPDTQPATSSADTN